MEISFYRYQLRFIDGDGVVEGVLLRAGGGYGCLQPWPKFGDLPLAVQLESLQAGRPTELVKQSLNAMDIDRRARGENRSALQSLDIPPSHFLLRTPLEAENIPLLRACGFTHVKSKFLPEVETLERYDILWRIDPNSSLSERELLGWWESLSFTARERVDFIEDPCVYNHELYQILARKIPLAIDWHCPLWRENPFAVKALVLKPAAFDILEFGEAMAFYAQQFVVTSSMDHPLGQCYAAHQAARLKEEFPRKTTVCGLNSHSVFSPNEFSTGWSGLTPQFLPPQGTGFGFDDLLKKLLWEEL